MSSAASLAPLVPAFSQDNPGQGTKADEVDLVAVLASVLAARGVPFERREERLDLDNGLILRPQFVQREPGAEAAVCTTSTIEVNHPALCPAGTFEYQHSIGQTLTESLQKGFTSWADTDLPVLRDALRDPLEECASLEIDSSGPRRRQVVLGPPVRAVARDAQEPEEGHAFCPCCLLTSCLEAFEGPLASDAFQGVRLFASRDAEGVVQADCRINGVDWPAGAEALLRYAASWPDRGFEYRKQFVVMRTLPSG